MAHTVRSQALARLYEITDGIDETAGETPQGWWETSTAAQFGAGRLRELRRLIVELTED